MARTHLTADLMMNLLLLRLAELDYAIAQSTDAAELRRLMSQRLDGYDMLTALSRLP